jgi:hypothetical protein
MASCTPQIEVWHLNGLEVVDEGGMPIKYRSAEDKFLTSGYIAQAFCDSGDFDQMLNAVSGVQ